MFENAEKNTYQCRIYIHVYSCIPGQIILVTTKILYIEYNISKQVERKKGGRNKEKIKNVNESKRWQERNENQKKMRQKVNT